MTENVTSSVSQADYLRDLFCQVDCLRFSRHMPRTLVLPAWKIRTPRWLDAYDSGHPLADVAWDLFKEEAFAREARRYRAGRPLLAAAYRELERFEDPSLPQRTRVAAGKRAIERFSEARRIVDDHVRAQRRRERYGRFPLLKGASGWPSTPLCRQCGKGKVHEPHAMAILSGGAMRVTDARRKSADVATDCIGFLDLFWHAGKSGQDVRLPLAEDTPAGQFDFYFCSTRCLRGFFESCVDELEARMAVPNPKRKPRASAK